MKLRGKTLTPGERIIGMGIVGTSRRVDYVARNKAQWAGGYKMKVK